MFELLIVLTIALFTLISGRDHPLLVIITTIILLPGLYALKTGAPFIPSSKKTLERMMRLAKIKRGDIVYDLGCGDGRLVFASTKAGAKAVGYELSPPTFLYAKVRSLFHPGSKIEYKNFWTQDYSKADVLFCYLLTSTMQTFKHKVWPTLKPGCRVVSHAFKMLDVPVREQEGNVVVYIK